MEHRHTKRHSSGSSSRREVATTTAMRTSPTALLNHTGVLGPCKSTPARPESVNDTSLTTVTEEDMPDVDDQLVGAVGALTSKHLLATTDSRSSYLATKDLGAYQTLCQQKSTTQVPNPYHALESVLLQNAKTALKSSEIASVDTGYKSTGSSSSLASRDMNAKQRKHTELHLTKPRDCVEPVDSLKRITFQNAKKPPDPPTLAAMLIEKLEDVQRMRNLMDGNHYRSREELEKEDAQSILDDHISRVFGDSSGELSPREKVSSWVMYAKKYCDMTNDTGNGSKGVTPMDISENSQRGRQRRQLSSSHRLGSMDEGLGRSINSLDNSAIGCGRTSQASFSSTSHDWTRTANDHTRSSHSRNAALSNHDSNRPFSNWFSLKSSNKIPSNSESATAASSSNREMTSVVYQIAGEKLPYLSKVADGHITLKQFRAIVPRKGKYRYFFKRLCEDLDVGAVFEEIADDNEILPLFEGKISARLEPID